MVSDGIFGHLKNMEIRIVGTRGVGKPFVTLFSALTNNYEIYLLQPVFMVFQIVISDFL